MSVPALLYKKHTEMKEKITPWLLTLFFLHPRNSFSQYYMDLQKNSLAASRKYMPAPSCFYILILYIPVIQADALVYDAFYNPHFFCIQLVQLI